MKKYLITLFSVVLAFGLLSCDFEIPKTVAVKTNASYKFSVGEVSTDKLAETFSVSSLISTDSMPEGAAVYDYFPGQANDNVQQLLISMPVTDIPVDISSYLDNTDFTSNIAAMSVDPISVTIPKIDLAEEKDLNMDSINNAINKGVMFGGLAVADSEASISFATDATDLCSFSSVSYKTGYLTVTQVSDFNGVSNPLGNNFPDGTVVTLKRNGVVIGTGTFNAGKAVLDMAGKTIYTDNMKVSFSNHAYGIYMAQISDDAELSKAVGVTVGAGNMPDISISPITIPFPETNVLKSLTVGEGNLSIGMNIPSTWSGVTMNYKISTTGGFVIDDDSLSAGNKNINLAGKTVIPQAITVTPELKIDFADATIDFNEEPKISVNSNITKFATIIVDASKYVDKTSVDMTGDKAQAIPADALEYISKVVFNECGIIVKYTNSFPAGNNVGVELTSGFFGLSNETGTLYSNKTVETELKLSKTDYTVKFGNDKAAGEFSAIDVLAKIILPNFNSTEKTMELVNVTPESTYEMAISVEPIVDWYSIFIKSAKQSNQISTEMNLSELFKSLDSDGSGLASKITVTEIPVYLYLIKPELDILKNAVFKGKLSAYYGKAGAAGVEKVSGAKTVYLLGSDTEDKSMSFIDEMPALQFINDDKTVVSELDKLPNSAKADFASLLTDSAATSDSSVYIDYDLCISTGNDSDFEIKKDDLPKKKADSEDKTVPSIKINAMITVPLELKTTQAINIDILKMANGDEKKDLFGRTEKPSAENEYQEFINVISDVKVTYEFTKRPFYASKEMALVMDMGNEQIKTFTFGKGEVGISAKDVMDMLSPENYPFSPSIEFTIPEETVFSIPRSLEIGVKLTLEIDTDGTVNLYDANKEKN